MKTFKLQVIKIRLIIFTSKLIKLKNKEKYIKKYFKIDISSMHFKQVESKIKIINITYCRLYFLLKIILSIQLNISINFFSSEYKKEKK